MSIKQAIEALEEADALLALGFNVENQVAEALTALRSMPAEPEPVGEDRCKELAELGWQAIECPACGSSTAKGYPRPAQQYPYAWHYTNNGGASVWHRGPSNRLDADIEAAREFPKTHRITLLYAAPHTAPKVVSSNLPVVSTALLSDAERYRWLRDRVTVSHQQRATATGVEYPTTFTLKTSVGSSENIDDAIDAALAGESKP